jgi:hypothetical protein
MGIHQTKTMIFWDETETGFFVRESKVAGRVMTQERRM